jgi:polysaccharide export outer membrane protein
MSPRFPIALIVLSVAGCAAEGPFIWADKVPSSRARAEPSSEIETGDLLNVRVWNQDGLSEHVRVRADGRISMLFIHEIDAAGKSPAQLGKEIEYRLENYFAKPVVSISVEETRPISISVLGEVTHPGSYALADSATVLQALASAGGLTDFAATDRIFVLRRTHGLVDRIRFTFKSLTGTSGLAPLFELRAGDVVVVE